jgi:hypothetical protein
VREPLKRRGARREAEGVTPKRRDGDYVSQVVSCHAPLISPAGILMKMATALLICLLASPALAMPQTTTTFTAQAGFGGASEGDGTLTLLFGKPRPYHVESYGHVLADGTFRLDQTVVFQGKPPTHRHWILSTVKPGEYTGTLSDAAGKVTGHTEGPRLTLRYRVKGPLVMHQALEMKPDGTIDNVGIVTLLGIPVGHLQETIVHKPTAAQ